jgi:hypothetical protein
MGNDRVVIMFLHVLVSPFKTQARLEVEIVLLRHQLNALRRRVPSKPRLTVADWGAPRIHGELLKRGFEVAQSTVAKYMARGGRGSSQIWKTFLYNHAAGIAAMDFLVVPTVGFKLLFVSVIL